MPSSEPYPSAPRRGSTKSLKHNGPMARQQVAPTVSRSRRSVHRASLSRQSTGSQRHHHQQQPVLLPADSRTNSVSIPDSIAMSWCESQHPAIDVEMMGDAFQSTESLLELSCVGAHFSFTDDWLLSPDGFKANAADNAPGLEWPAFDVTNAFPGSFPSQRSQAIVNGMDPALSILDVNYLEIPVDPISVHDSLPQPSYLEQSIDSSNQFGGGIPLIPSPQTSPSLTHGTFSPVPSLIQAQNIPANAMEPVPSEDQAVSEKAADDNSGKQDKNQPVFACPFHRLDPVRHMDCLNRRMTRIRDIKQHLQRRHYEPPSCCPVCYTRFVTPTERDEHVRVQNCEPRSPETSPNTEWVSPATQGLLKQPASRGSLPTDQWYAIWDILFPNMDRPANPYLGTCVEESVGMLQHFWKREGENVSEWFLENKQKDINKDDLKDIISRLLDQVRAHPYREHDATSAGSEATPSANDPLETWVYLESSEGAASA